MNSCNFWSLPTDPSALRQGCREQQALKYPAKVTAIALGAITVLLFASSCAMWGLGTSPGMMLTGVSFFPFLVGSIVGCVTLGVGIGGALFTLKYAYHATQESRMYTALEAL